MARIPFTSSGPPDLESSDSGEGKEEDLPEELIEEASYLFIYLFIFGCVGSSFLCEGFL